MDPAPQSRKTIFTPALWDQLTAAFEVVEVAGTDDQFDALLPRAWAIVGQPDMDAERLARATALRAILNVEGNFFPNIAYDTAFNRGVYVLSCGPAYADSVAEYSLGLALDVARGITSADRSFREGTERYTADGNDGAMLLRGSNIGLLGFGNLGRALIRLLAPFDATVRVYDPWLPDAVLRESGVLPSPLNSVLSTSQVLFVLAAITEENRYLLDEARLGALPDHARVVLVSRAAAADFEALYKQIETGRLHVAIDVWPEEPMPADDRARTLHQAVLSAHRAGGIAAAFHTIGSMVIDDLTLIARGLPPVRMQVGARELVGRYRSRPVGV